MDSALWEHLMERVIAEVESADYQPGQVMAPGSGSEGDSPFGDDYIDLGPLAFVLNEAVDMTVTRGADRVTLLEAIAQAAGEGITEQDAEDVLSGEEKCPDINLLHSFSAATSIDYEIILDAAQRGGCKNYGGQSYPPGY